MQKGYETNQTTGNLGERGIALILDLAIVSVTSFSVYTALAGYTPLTARQFDAIMGLTAFMFAVGYESLFVEKYGATPGKMLFRLKVVTTSGEAVRPGRAFGRSLFKQFTVFCCSLALPLLISPPNCGILVIGGLVVSLLAVTDAEGRALYDRICGTRVVRR